MTRARGAAAAARAPALAVVLGLLAAMGALRWARAPAPAAVEPPDGWVGVEDLGQARVLARAEAERAADSRCAGASEASPGELLLEGCPARRRQLPLGTLRVLELAPDLNRLEVEDFEALPGIGPRLAREIVRERRARGGFSSVEELDEVRGIGPSRLATLRSALNRAAR